MKVLSFDVGIINLAYCIFDTTLLKLIHWEVITLNGETNYNKLYINLITQLDIRKHMISDIDVVLIEKQPSFNPKMRIIAGCLQTYFIIRGIVDLPGGSMKSVEFFSPKHKLKCYSGPELVIDSKCKSKYSKTKKMGILICREKLHEYHENPETIKLFEQSKKKDDLADCYLQAITYAIFKKILPLSHSTQTPQKIPDKSLSKAITKVQVKAYLDSNIVPGKYSNVELMNFQNNTTSIPLMGLFNDIGSNLKDSLVAKYNVTFPLTYETLINLLNTLGMKSYLIKKINCSLHCSSVL
jgi:hypothetical protein